MKSNKDTQIRYILAGCLRRHMLLTILLVLAIIASVILELFPALILGQAVDSLTDNKMISAALCFGYFGVTAAAGVCKSVREGLVTAVGEKLTHALRSAMSRKLSRLPASVFTDSTSGSISARFTSDADAFEAMFSSGIVSLFSDLGTVVGMTFVIFTKSLGLGLILLVVLPLLFVFTRVIQKRMLAAHTQNRRAVAKVTGFLPETVANIRTIHVFNSERFAERKYDEVIGESFAAIEKTNFYDAFYSPVILTTSAAVIGVMMTLAGLQGPFLALFGITVGTAVTVISYVGQIFKPLESIGMEIQTIQSAAAGIKRIREYLALPEKEPEEEAQGQRQAQEASGGEDDAVISLKDVSFSYDGKQNVLSHFSMEVKKGERVVLTGRTGAGKSTVFRLVLGLYTPQEGEVRLAGRDPARLPQAEKRSLYGCVEQTFRSVQGTIMDQITLGNPDITREACSRALELVGLGSLISHLDDPYSEELLSHGQHQLLLIARAVVCDPPILLLDEITSGLDSATEKTVMEALRRASQGRTVLSVSHRLMADSTDRIVPVGKTD
ncbi:MAG: ABC transporter ATP-binding protein [Lachnospiraceae bacterium]|jgi:ATP-binding cassette subfamily B multidrug efflux pump